MIKRYMSICSECYLFKSRFLLSFISCKFCNTLFNFFISLSFLFIFTPWPSLICHFVPIMNRLFFLLILFMLHLLSSCNLFITALASPHRHLFLYLLIISCLLLTASLTCATNAFHKLLYRFRIQ